jgi:hypothetical protein
MASNTLTDVKNIDRLRARYEANAKGGSEQPVFGAAQGGEPGSHRNADKIVEKAEAKLRSRHAARQEAAN